MICGARADSFEMSRPSKVISVGGDGGGIGQQPHHRQHRDRFARAAFADDGQHLAAIDMHVDALDGRELPTAVANLTVRFLMFSSAIGSQLRFSLGSSASRSPSPIRLMASTVIRMARPGKVTTHQARR
jgi:hypothetical protein